MLLSVGNLLEICRLGYKPGVPAGAPENGDPGDKYKDYLLQRSNATLSSVMSRPDTTGKAILAFRNSDGVLAVIVQPDGRCAMRYQDIRDALVSAGFSNAVFVDGSDSALFYARRGFFARPGQWKNAGNTVGIGFRCR